MSATIDRAAFLAERSTGIGGSDIASVFNLGYGCRLRLWREKRGQEPDYPSEESGPMELGVVLEPHIAAKYEKKTGRSVAIEGVRRHVDSPELLVHVDRIIYSSHRPDLGVLECKAVGRAMYWKIKREGMPEDYILQLQHGMLVTNLQWGSFAVMNRDNGDLLWWDVSRDEAVCREILQEGPIFWAQVQNGPAPEPLDPEDRRCQTCEYRLSCQGNALVSVAKESEYQADESLRPLVLEFLERRALAKEADDLLDETKEAMKAALGDRGMVTAAGVKIQYYTITKKEYTVKQHEERPLRVYPAKEKR